jgi:DNA-binding transcriptional LysR family regulator
VRIEQLEYVAAVTAHGSLRRASEALHISQPALSEAVTKLERELGLTLIDRHRSGSRMSRQGRDLLQHMTDVLESVDRLRQAAGDQAVRVRELRIGMDDAASPTVLVPALRDLHTRHDTGAVEIVISQRDEIHQGLAGGTLDLGLVNVLPGDDVPTGLVADELIHGRPVACLRTDHPLVAGDHVTVAELREQPFVAMRPGHPMHRFAHRLFAGAMPATTYVTNGVELGRAMVAEGLGISILPDYSIIADPLMTAGVITSRPIHGDDALVSLLMLRRDAARVPAQLRELQSALVRHASVYRSQRSA